MIASARSCAVLTLCLGLAGPALAQDAPRLDVPIQQTVLPNGNVRYSIPVSVGGGAPIETSLDTGSFGLRVLSKALNPSQYEATDEERNYPFGGGARFRGILAKATIGIGGLSTAAPVLFQLVQSVDCTEHVPHCPASRIDQKHYRIAGDGIAGQGFEAIIGTSMRRAMSQDGAENPLGTMGSGRWIVILPRPGSPTPGHLIINPTSDDTAGFASIQLDPLGEAGATGTVPGWKDAALPGCLVKDGSGEKICGATALDSGAPGFNARSSEVSKPTPWSEGTAATFEMSLGQDTMRIPFTVGRDWSTRVHIMPDQGERPMRLSAGSLPFFSYAVLYDSKAGTMGFKARSAEEP